MAVISLLEGKHIILAATGSVAVYKAIDLASKLTQAGAIVHVVMTEAAQHFVSPLTFESVTGRHVYTDIWAGDPSSGGLPTHIAHVGLGESADLIAIVPATANTIAKLAHGMADDLVTVTALAARCPILIAPAMDGSMYEHPATQANVQTLVERGVHLVEPEQGRFASGLVGKGRLPETATLIGHIRNLIGRDGPLRGRVVVVTAGGTREALDPVRYISNRSSGKQGYAVARAAQDAGARVILVTTAQHLPDPIGMRVHHVDTAEQMRDVVLDSAAHADALVMAAAVADFRPAAQAEQKIKKQIDNQGHMVIDLARTPDILMSVKASRESSGYPRVVVGFAAETENLLDHARGKLERKGLDLLVANDVSESGIGFGADHNRVTVLDAGGGTEHLPRQSKALVGEAVVARIVDLLGD